MAPSNDQYDFIIVGGGTAGCVLASRLIQRNQSLKIGLIEAGKDVTHHPHVSKPQDAPKLHFSEIDWAYTTVPQHHLDGKPRYNCGVKALSGGVAINSGGWVRGDALDYAEWSDRVSDKRWSYEGLLKYFKMTEHHFDPNADPTQHGFDGPMYTSSASSSGRKYPLRKSIQDAWSQIGLKQVPDANNGSPTGFAELVENRRDGLRQLTSVVYPLNGVHVMTDTVVARVLISEGDNTKSAVGVELADGHQLRIKPSGEVIVSSGAYRSPQVLLLSGIGNSSDLEKHGIEQQAHLPGVGQNLHDHLMVFRYWKLHHPEHGLAIGSPLMVDPAFAKGNPADWLATMPIPHSGLKAAIERDESASVSDDHVLLKGPRSHIESTVLYAVFGQEQIGLDIPLDGTAIMSFYLHGLPTSRGNISLQSTDPTAPPIIDPNYNATQVDKFALREGYRIMSRLFLDTPEGQSIVKDEITPPGHGTLGSDASDDLIDQRIKMGAISCYHPAGTCSMGKVVDSSLKVIGVNKLRVVDASITPVPLMGHYQAPVLAIAEQAVDIILSDH
ncbi:MAG: hypothetical protein M1820_008380 [Bogoriella megaspora]|nr:MAG: hypothetical protein M1820_008380 [Bogoriella megaspora]